MSQIRSNWTPNVTQGLWGNATEDTSETEEQSDGDQKEIWLSLEDAATILAIRRDDGRAWRKRVHRKLRAIQLDIGESLYESRRGRSGTRVSFRALCRALPLSVAGLETVKELRAKLLQLEQRLAAAESGKRE